LGDLRRALSAETETVEQRVMAGACSLLRKYDKTQCADFDPIDANVGALDSRIIKHDTELANLKASIEILSKGLVAWSQPFPQSATLFGDAFDAPPSLSLSCDCNLRATPQKRLFRRQWTLGCAAIVGLIVKIFLYKVQHLENSSIVKWEANQVWQTCLQSI
jgi:hypothetical protein